MTALTVVLLVLLVNPSLAINLLDKDRLMRWNFGKAAIVIDGCASCEAEEELTELLRSSMAVIQLTDSESVRLIHPESVYKLVVMFTDNTTSLIVS